MAQQQQDDTEPGRRTRAYVRKTVAPRLSYPGEADFPQSKEVGAALIATAATNPKLLEPLRERCRVWQHAIEQDGIGPTRTTVIRLAVDGLWLADVLGIWSPSDQLRRQVLNELIRLTRAGRQGAHPPITDSHRRPPTRRQRGSQDCLCIPQPATDT
jgi:hypothetical protein